MSEHIETHNPELRFATLEAGLEFQRTWDVGLAVCKWVLNPDGLIVENPVYREAPYVLGLVYQDPKHRARGGD